MPVGQVALRDLAASWLARFEFVPVLSGADGDTWTGRRGNVSDVLLSVLPSLGASALYMCGPPAMVDAVDAVAVRTGVEHRYADRFFDQSHVASMASRVPVVARRAQEPVTSAGVFSQPA